MGTIVYFSGQIAFLKRILKISGKILLALLLLLVLVTLLLQTEWAQNLVIRYATDRLSKDLRTRVSIDHVSIGFFNKLNLEGALIEDQNKDTLLYAGKLKINITDWFFLKNQAELEYAGLENASIRLHRSDSVWNYQFLIDAFTPKNPQPQQGNAQEILLKAIDLKAVTFVYNDEWIGQRMEGRVGSLVMRADEFNVNRKKVFISSLVLDQPYFLLSDFDGKKPDDGKTRKKKVKADDMPWNAAGWDIMVSRFSMRDGEFRSEQSTERPAYEYFDGAHIRFYGISGTITNLNLQKDTLTGKLNLQAKERSGFTVNSLKADLRFFPEGMIFKNLDLQTPQSRLRNYYAMRYTDFNKDMGHYIENVKMEASFSNSTLSSDDIAYFAPELKKLKKTVQLSGKASGTVENLAASDIKIQYGKNSSLTGNLKMTGLPDIDKTYIDFSSGELKTTYADVTEFAPDIKKIDDPNVASLGYLRFRGSFRGYLRDFNTKGTLETGLGTVLADVNLKIPKNKTPDYSGNIQSTGFDLGTFLNSKILGGISFNTKIKGSGFTSASAIDLDGQVIEIEFNKYLYRNVMLKGKLFKKEFTGEAVVDDDNAKARLNGFFNLNNPDQPELNVTAEIQRAYLKPLHFSESDMRLLGKVKVNFLGKKIDDFIGEASLFDVALTKDDETYVFDTLHIYSQRVDNRKQIEVKNSDISVSLEGDFTLSDIPQSLNAYLGRYYPTYFNKSKKPLKKQEFTVKAEVKNIDQYLKLFNKKLSGFDNSSFHGTINTEEEIFLLDASIPQASFGKYRFQDFQFNGSGTLDSLRMKAGAGMIVINDSLQFPLTSINIIAAGDVSDVNISTAANQTINAANLSVRLTHLTDGLKIQFNPSTIVLNQKTWRIDKNGELTISRSLVDASEIRMSNGDQELLISSIPSEIGNSHDLILTLHKVNLGDFLPFVLEEPRIQGITSGEITVEDPLNKLKVYVNAQTDQTRFEEDSIGITTVNGYWERDKDLARFHLNSDNPHYIFNIDGGVNLSDSSNRTIDAQIVLDDTRLSLIKTYLSSVFSQIDGQGKGSIHVIGNVKAPDLVGSIALSDAGVKVDYTQVYYKLNDPVIEFKPGIIDLGEITVSDELGNTGEVTGTLKHKFFRQMEYNFRASSKKLLVLDTKKINNDVFYGRAIARMNFSFTGNQKNMKMYVNGDPVDSSRITILTSGSSKQTGEVDYIMWKQYGREMNVDSLEQDNSNLAMDFDISANKFLRMSVVLDEITGDSITATGDGSVKILTSTNEAMVMNGRYTIDRGAYNFNFQDIFNKPFTLEQGSGSYISWSGDPYNADININATYLAEKVRMSTLFEESKGGVSSVNSDLLSEISDVVVKCNLSGTLSAPSPSFEISMPANSPVKNNPAVDNKLKTINRDPNEVSKQSTYLIVFKSFAPQAAIVTTDLSSELINTTISGVINSILSNSVQNFFYKLFGSSMDVNFNYSRIASNQTGNSSTPTTSTSGLNYRENVSLEFIKSLVNNRLVVTFGSDFNFTGVGSSGVATQSFIFLPDVNVEYKITPDGRFRTSFFYRSSFDAMSTSGRRDRTGGNISYRTEFDYLFPRKKKVQAVADSTNL